MNSIVSIYQSQLLTLAAGAELASAAGRILFNEELERRSPSEIADLVADARQASGTVRGALWLIGRVFALTLLLVPIAMLTPVLALLAKKSDLITRPRDNPRLVSVVAEGLVLLAITLLAVFMRS